MLDPVGEQGEAGPVGERISTTAIDTEGMVPPSRDPRLLFSGVEDELADLQADDEQVQVPAFDVDALPDVARGEAPPADPLPQAPATPPVPEPPPAPAPPPAVDPITATPNAGTWKDEDGNEYPEPPLIYLSRSAKLRIQIASGGRGRTDSEGNWHEPRPAKALQFGPGGGNPLFQCRVDTRERVKWMEDSKKFKTGVVWRGRDEAERAIAHAERNLAILKAQARGDKPALAELLATQPQVIEGARSTRNEPSPDGTPDGLASGPFVGVSALLNDRGRAGMAFRDGIRHAQARGEPGF